MLSKQKKSDVFIYLSVLLISVYIAYQIPYTHDDWDWGIDMGLTYLFTADINSRYVGNFFEVIMTRSVTLKTLIMGITCFAVPLLMVKLSAHVREEGSGKNNGSLFLLSTALLLSLEKDIVNTTFNWTAGFANYIISLVFLGAFYWLIFTEEKDDLMRDLLCGLVTLAAQLFLENITVYILMVSLIVLLLKRKKKYIFMFAGAVIGTVLMFSSSVYLELLSTGTGLGYHREVVFDSGTDFFGNIINILNNYFTQLFGNAYVCSSNVCIVLSLSLLCETILKKQELDKKCFIAFVAADCVCTICYCIIYGVMLICGIEIIGVGCSVTAGAVFLITVIVQTAVLFGKDHRKRNILLFLVLSSQIVIAPLMVVKSGFSLRSHITPAFILIIVSCAVIDDILLQMGDKYPKVKCDKLFMVAASVLLTVVFVRRIFIFSAIGAVDRQRRDEIRNCDFSVQKEIQLAKYPYSDCLVGSEPSYGMSIVFFKEFYGIPEDVDVVFVE